MEYKQNSTKFFLWAMNEKYFRANYNRAILSDASETSQSPNVPFEFPESSNVIEVGNDKKYVRIVLLNKGFFDFFRHPMHLHGHDMQVLAVGKGQWDGKIVNPENPLRRDTQIIPGQGFLVLQYEVDNAGIWPLHCHIAVGPVQCKLEILHKRFQKSDFIHVYP